MHQSKQNFLKGDGKLKQKYMPSRENILCVNIFYKRLHSCWFLRIKNRFSVFGTLVCELMPSEVEKIAEQNTEKKIIFIMSLKY